MFFTSAVSDTAINITAEGLAYISDHVYKTKHILYIHETSYQDGEYHHEQPVYPVLDTLNDHWQLPDGSTIVIHPYLILVVGNSWKCWTSEKEVCKRM